MPPYSSIVSIMSAISRWISGERISSGERSRAGVRRTGWPIRATLRMAMVQANLAHIHMREVLVFRHGETDWNVEGRIQGHLDVPLNDRGREQARRLIEPMRRLG